MRRKLPLLTAAAMVAIAGLTTISPAHAATTDDAATPVLTLPAPTGRFPVGLTSAHLVDEGRPDPWMPTVDRELMVTLWYPASRPGRTPATYMTEAESAAFVEGKHLDLPSDILSKVATHATVDAKPVKGERTLPLVLLSPGFTAPRAELTALAEDLASRGYVVAAVGHNYETYGITFPDGRTTPCVACESDDVVKATAARGQDLPFVVDELTKKHPAVKAARLIDPRRIAAGGQSLGGGSAIPAMLADPRIDAGVNMDGTFRYRTDVQPDRPFMLLGNPRHAPGMGDTTWDATWAGLDGWKRWLTVDGFAHSSFTDSATFGEQLGIPVQELDGDYCVELTRTYFAAFVDTHLKGAWRPILDGPSGEHPEVRFHNP